MNDTDKRLLHEIEALKDWKTEWLVEKSKWYYEWANYFKILADAMQNELSRRKQNE